MTVYYSTSEVSASETAEEIPAKSDEVIEQAPEAPVTTVESTLTAATSEQEIAPSNPVVAEMVVYINDKPITLKGKDKYIFVNIFDYYEFDLSESGGRSVITRLNGESAPYTAELKSGDKIELGWQE
jgi:sulfur carrier protein ThiS